ncbi:MAG: hypothetical protein LBP59_12775 [Planctomycetaceae bacterium]|jgi:hypothetical protein|nr:hypothetical protein [Planctomycetaceae bacterium]
MKRYNIFEHVVFLFSLLVTSGFSFGALEEGKLTVPIEEPLKIFQMIGEQSRSNYEKIKTWQGEYAFEERFVFSSNMSQLIEKNIGAKLPSEFVMIQKGKFIFCIDIRKDALFVDYHPESVLLEDISGHPISLEKDAKNKLEKTSLKRIVSIVTPKEFYSFDKNSQIGSYPKIGDKEDRVGRVAFRYPSTDSHKIGIKVDPRTFMVCGGEFFWIHCQRIADKSRPLRIKTDANDSNVYLNEIGSSKSIQYQIYYDFNGRENMVFEYIVDGNSAFNVIKYANGAGFIDKGYTIREKNIFEYKKVDDIYIPFVFEKNLGETSKNNLFELCNRYELLKTEINKPLPPDIFTIERLGLEDGDRYYDKVKNKLFEMIDGKIVPMRSGTSWQPNRISAVRIVLIVAGCLLMLIGIFRKLRKKVNK